MPLGNPALRSEGTAAPSTHPSESTPHRIVVKSVNGHEPIKQEASVASSSRLPSSQIATPQSSPTKSTAPASPIKSPGRPRRVEPVIVSSRDFGPSAASDSDDESRKDTASDLNKANGMKRTVDRKSKTDAMSALTGKEAPSHAAQSSETSPATETIPPPGDPARHPARKMTLVQPFPPLVFNSSPPHQQSISSEAAIPTSTSTPRQPPPRLRSRLFDLEEAPTFYPTEEEFQDPMKYISWIAHPHGGNGKAYGIVKVVPPQGWQPDCVLDEQTFRFRTRVQRLNSLSADARASQNYQEQLQKFHAQQGRKRVSVPVIDGRSVDLYQLKLTIASMGGYDAVCRGRRWADATKNIGYSEKDSSQLSTQVKAAYTRIILPFEEFMTKAREQARANGSSVSPTIVQNATMAGLSNTESADAIRRASHSPGLDGTTSIEPGAASSTPEPFSSQSGALASTEALALANGDLGSLSPSAGPSTRRSARKRSEVSTPASASRGPIVSASSPATPVSSRRRKGASPHVDTDTPHRTAATLPGAEEQMCEICLRGEDGLNMLLCDECNRGFHMYCLQPPLTAIPKSQWFCPPCLVGTGHDFGFDDGETHSLYSFWQRAEAFKKAWWSARPERIWKPTEDGDLLSSNAEDGTTNGLARKIPGTDLVVSEDDVEREFWRLVHSQNEEIEVEYGADVHSTTHGSALPTQETHPLNPYSKEKWNLNNLPILPGSLLQYIKSDISGMTVPWIYVGMVFSTFCWHNEDHYTYSINYQHWGETKTWYGIPGEDADKFEDAMRRAAPDLFETLPDLLFHLTTMMSPEKLKKEGVRVVACDQRANEFVITFPKAYHSGFNHGLNLNEAVNFALPDWIFDDLDSVRRYQQFRKPAVFSHDQLLITVSQQSQTIETAVWLEAAMQEMVDREISKRNALREIIPDLVEEVYDEDVAESSYQCAHCTIFCYLGQLISPKAEGVACLDHGFEVCNADAPTKWTLKLRFSDDQLRSILAKVSEKAAIPRNWLQRLKKTLALGPNPPLKTLRTLMHEGEKISYPLEPLEDLRAFVNCANAWVERANAFLTRKVHKRRGEVGGTSNGRGRRSIAGTGDDSFNTRASIDASADDAESGSDRSPEALTALLNELEVLHFDAPEIISLRSLAQDLEDFIAQCDEVLRHSNDSQSKKPSLKDCENLLTLGSSLNVDAQQIKELSHYVERRKWIAEVEDVQHGYLYHHEVADLLERAEQCGLGEHEFRTELERRLKAGEEWTEKAKAALDCTHPATVDELEELSETSTEISVVLEVAQNVANLLTKAKELQKTVQTIHKSLSTAQSGMVNHGNDGDLSMISVSENDDAQGRMALLPEARKVLRAAKSHKLKLEHIDDLEHAVKVYDAWRSDFIDVMQAVSQGNKRLTEADREAELAKLIRRVENATDPSDDQPRASSRNCVCRSSDPIQVPSSSTGECSRCRTKYHLSCIKVRSSEVSRAGGNWRCPFCPWTMNAAVLKSRKSVDLSDIAKLVYEQGHRRDQLKFLPVEWDAIEEIVAKAKRFETAAKRMIKTLSLMRRDQKETILSHWLRRAIACPVDVLGPERVIMLELISENLLALGPEEGESAGPRSVAADESIDVDASFGSEPPPDSRLPPGSTRPPGPSDSVVETAPTPSTARDDRKRKAKRGKRAKLVFREEIGIGAYRDGQPIYCLCHQPESGRMIACDKCMLWFHTHCVRLDDPPNLGNEAWICPMCCIKAERKYPQAEVRVKEMGVTDPDLWLDIRATLRSLEKPVSKIQSWNSREDRRIILHLEKFQPAIHAEEVHANPNKRARLDADPSFQARASLGRADSGAAADAPAFARPPIPSEAARGIVPSADSAAAVVSRTSKSFSPASPMQEHRARQPSIHNAPEWAQASRRRHEEGMQNLYRRGVTDTMLLRYYIGWNGYTLVHPVRYSWNDKIVEVELGEKIELHPDDPEGARIIKDAIERYNDRMRRTQDVPSLSSYPPPARLHDGSVAARQGYRSDEHRYHSSASAPSRYADPNLGDMAGYSPMGASSRLVSSRERERDRDREGEWDRERGASSRDPRDLRALAYMPPPRSPTPRSAAAHEAMPTYARPLPLTNGVSGGAVAGSMPPPSPHSRHTPAFGTSMMSGSPMSSATTRSGLPLPPARISTSTPTGTPIVPSSSSGLSSSYRTSLPPPPPPLPAPAPVPAGVSDPSDNLPLDPALNEASNSSAAIGDIDPALTGGVNTSLATAAAASASKDLDSSIKKENGTDPAVEEVKTSEKPKPKKEEEEEEEEARKMAKRMRPNASEGEIDEMVRAFLSTPATGEA